MSYTTTTTVTHPDGTVINTVTTADAAAAAMKITNDNVMLCEHGAPDGDMSDDDLRAAVHEALDKLGPRKNVLIVPPDYTRAHSQAGKITKMVYDYYGDAVKDIMPALGSHDPMTISHKDKMFEGVPHDLFRVHNWRTDVETLGTVPASFVGEVSEGAYTTPYPVQMNKMVTQGGHDLILSIGQVVPHEVAGMANQTKNLLVGVGGKEAIDAGHITGAAYGMEKIMSVTWNPVRKIFTKAWDDHCSHLPVVWMLTVCAKDVAKDKEVIRGFYTGTGHEGFEKAAALAQKTNFTILDEEMTKCVVWLDPEKFHSTWLGNKALYRTRMAMADDAELIVLAPSVSRFGEDLGIDKLIRKYGYRTSPEIMGFVRDEEDMKANLSAAAHLIHGSSEGRFRVTWAPGNEVDPGTGEALSRADVEGVGYGYGVLEELMAKYKPGTLKDGWNEVDGERIYFISNPALGLWAHKSRLGA